MDVKFKNLNRFLNFAHLGFRVVPNQVTLTLSCSWCAKKFQWTGSPLAAQPHVCSPGHSTKAKRARKRRRENAVTPPQTRAVTVIQDPQIRYSTGTPKPCPRPEKVRHKSLEEALETIKRVDPEMHPYRCVCGHIHVGH